MYKIRSPKVLLNKKVKKSSLNLEHWHWISKLQGKIKYKVRLQVSGLLRKTITDITQSVHIYMAM
jgi:hypothetical protein